MNLPIVLCIYLAVSIFQRETATNAPVPALTNSAEKIEARYQSILQLDEAALTDIQNLIKNWNAQQNSEASPRSEEDLRKVIRFKVDAVKTAYRDFLRENPNHIKTMIAFGRFLCDMQEEQEGVQWWEKARELEPKNAAVRNNLANYYGHEGEPKRAIEEYEAAISIQPGEPMYHFNLANIFYLFRKETSELKKWSEEEVFDHALESFRKARDLEPGNYDYAYAYAETFYGVKNPNWNRALDAWDYCLKLNITPLQREQIYTHLARINLRLDRIGKARDYLAQVKSEQWQDLRTRLTEIATHRDAVLKVQETLHPDTAKGQ
jgi:tetratricopeptide (TPR) repeat protein